MLRNHFNIAIRNAIRHKGFALINIAGLSIGLICSFFILMWITDELSYNRFHKDGNRIFQVWRHMITEGQIDTWPSLGQPVAETIGKEYPEIENITFIDLDKQFIVTIGNNNIRQNGGYVSPTFFEIFTFPFIRGDSQNALKDVNSVVITERLATSLFGKEWQQGDDIIGRSITIDHRKDFTITGVLKNIPENSSLQFDVLLPTRDLTDRLKIAESWYFMTFDVYAKVHESSSLKALNEKVYDHFIRHNQGKGTQLFFQPFEDVYLHSTYKDGQLVGGRIEYIRIFSIVAVFLILIACINFMNLATARSSRRAREIGVRKVVGAKRGSLIMQFIVESMAMTVLSFLIALGFFFMLLPAFNELTGKTLTFSDLNLPGILAIVAVVGIISGSYPALYLSSFNPISALRSKLSQHSGNSIFRKGLVIFQFTLSVIMIIATAGVFLQLGHMRTLNLGMNREGLVFFPREGALAERYDLVAQQLLNSPGIASVTASGQDPLNVSNNTTSVNWPGKPADNQLIFYIINANYHYIETMGMGLIEGRDFSKEHPDSNNFLVNEEAAKLMGGNVVGKNISVYGDNGNIVGIVKNFSMNSLYSPIEPTIIRFDPPRSGRIYVRTEAGQIQEALGSLEAVCKQFNPGFPFEYTFMDQLFEKTYRSESIMGKLSNLFAFISVFISCLGLLGLIAFSVEQRTKEVGIRKVLGASVTSIATLLSSEFVKLVLIGIVIAIPVAAYFMNEWLQHFSSRINMPIWLYALPGVIALLLAIATISIQSIRAALRNPVNTLRSE